MAKQTEKMRIEGVAEIIKQIFQLVMFLKLERTYLEKLKDELEHRYTMATAGSVILEATGIDSSEKEMETVLYMKRLEALLNLIDTLDETEANRKEFNEGKEKRAEARKQLSKIFGE